MATFHFSGTIISRTQGQSAVECATYWSTERLINNRDGAIHDYTKKRDIIFKDTLIPNNVPLWIANRERLWNVVEAQENEKMPSLPGNSILL